MDFYVSSSSSEVILIAILASVAAVGVAVQAFRRPGAQRGVRLAAGLGAVLALAGLALQPGRLVATAPAAALLVTPGADAARAADLADSLGVGHVFALPGAAEQGRAVPDVATLRRRHPAITTLHVVGHGFAPEDAAAATAFQVAFYPAPAPPGVQTARWTRTLGFGKRLQVHGQVATTAAAQLFLESPGGRVDSAAFGGPGHHAFTLTDLPPDTGAVRYVLHLAAPGGPVAAETLAVAIAPPDSLRVLLLRGAPDFETRHLATFLGEAGAAVAVRTAVSRDRAQTTFINHPDVNLDRLTPALLARTSLVSLDARSLAALSAAERRALSGAVRDGLGLLLAPDVATMETAAARSLTDGLVAASTTSERTVRLADDDGRSYGAPVPVAPARLGDGPAIRPLVRDEAGAVVAAFRPAGLGRIAIVLPTETFRWRLAGDDARYAAYWSTLVAALARTPLDADRWTLATTGPFQPHHPLDLVLDTSRPAPHGRIADPGGRTDTLFLRQDPDLPTRWQGRYWPHRAGWHRATAPDGQIFRFYVDSSAAWAGVRAEARRTATHALAERSTATAGEARGRRPAPFPPLVFFLLFVASTAVLWSVERWRA